MRRAVERDVVCESVVHMMRHSVHGKRLSVHAPRSRTVWTWRITSHERLMRIRQRITSVVAHIRECGAASHGDVVRMAHWRDVLTVGCLRDLPGVRVVS